MLTLPRGRVAAALTVVVVASGATLLATPVEAGAPAAADDGFGPRAHVERSATTGAVRFVGTEANRPLPAPDGITDDSSATAAARAFVTQHAAEFGLPANATLRELDTTTQATGRTAVRLQQVAGGLEVMGAQFVVQLDDANRIVSTAGEALNRVSVSESSITAAEAARIAAASVARAERIKPNQVATSVLGRKIFDSRIMGGPGLERPTTVWSVQASVGDLVRREVLVDVQLGAVVAGLDEIHTAKDRRVCDAGNANAQLPCVSPVLVEGGTYSGSVPDVMPAYELSGETYDFFFTKFGRDSIDGAGMPLRSTVRYCHPAYVCPYANAFWNGSQMTYGQGYAAADDVVGHELAHGVTDFTSGLFYYYQSGAINESISDVFGELIDLQHATGSDLAADRWKVGEDLPIDALRDMEEPGLLGDPARMLDPLYYSGEDDNGGVHFNSGVNNKAASLLVDGGLFNGRTVTGLGADKVAALYYEVDTGLLTSASDYANLASALAQGCTNLIGTAVGMTSANCVEVADAVAATEMATPRPEASDEVECTAATPQYGFFDNLEGANNWTATQPWFSPQNPNPLGFDATYATSGDTNMWGYDRDGDEFGTGARDYSITLNTPVTVPSGGFLRFSHSYLFDHYGSTNYDGGRVEYTLNGTDWLDAMDSYPAVIDGVDSDASLAGQAAFAGVSKGYRTSVASLAHLAGKQIRLRFRISSDSWIYGAGQYHGQYGWFIDDIGIGACGAVTYPTPPAPTAPMPPAPTPPVTPAPTLAKAKVKVTKKQVQLTYAVTSAGTLSVAATAKGLKKAIKAKPATASGSTTVKLKISKALATLLKDKAVKLQVTATLANAGGQATAKQKVKLKKR